MSALEIESEWRPRVNPWVIAGSVMLATFMEVLDTTVVSVALPNMAGGLSSTNEEATWVLTSYLVANAIVLPASGWFSLRCGRKRFLMICTALFTLGSFLCGIAPSMPFLVLARMLQGAGGGALQPLSQAILLESFPRKQHGMAMAAFGIGVVVAPIIGPLLGGWLTDNYSWRWMFYINIPIGLLSLYLMRQNLEDPPYIRESKPGSIDAVGFAFLIIWLSTLQIVLDKGQQEDWFASTWISWFSVISVSAMALLIVRELRTPEPIVDLRVFKNRNFWIGNLLMTIVSAVMYSAVAMVPLFVQTLLGYTAFSAGIATAPRGIGAMAAMPIVGKLMSHMDGKWLVMLGAALMVVSTLMFANVSLDTAMIHLVLPNILQGFGIALVMVPLMAITVGTLPKAKIGNASGIFNLTRNLAGSIGISISTTYLARLAQVHQANLVGHMSAHEPIFRERLAAFQGALSSVSGAPQARVQAYALMNRILLQQSTLKAFVDIFAWTALLAVLCIPGALFLKKVLAREGVALH
ncbi:MAG: DHA2 family efflux MFS transporter permease subunit [Acidobacteriota bacterium]|jgi:DHA2 family multidrug resistance protein|nr:DHA2 family efflux MFS transporter permease subunit [Acidobacteriota bacterium]